MNWLYTLVFAGLLFNSGGDSNSPARNFHISFTETESYKQSVSDESETIEKTFQLSKGGRVSVSNVNGAIEVEAWDRDEVRLVAVKTAETREALESVDIRIDSEPDFLNIRADYKNRVWREGDNRSKDRVNVSFKLQVPQNAVLDEIGTVNGSITITGFTNRVRASAVNGTVRGVNLSGAVSLSTVNGEVLADFDRLEGKGRINLETVNGKIVLLVPSNSDAVLRADTLNGNITNDVGLSVRKSGFIGRNLSGKIGNGTVSVRLSNVNGSIAITRKTDGKPLSTVIDLPSSRLDSSAEPAMPEAVTSRNKRLRVEAAIAVDKAIAEVEKAVADAAKTSADIEALEIKKAELEKLKEMNAAKIKDMANLPDKVVVAPILSNNGIREPLIPAMNGVFPPFVGRYAESISAEGVKRIVVLSPNCQVRIRGLLEKKEISFSVTSITRTKERVSLKPSISKTDDQLTITVPEIAESDESGFFPSNCKLDLAVPQKSNIKVNSKLGIRIQDIKGNLELAGDGGPIDIRDSEGSLSLKSVESLVRVVGFTGDLAVDAVDSEAYLDGDFNSINAESTDGSIVVTLPSNIGAEVIANAIDVALDGFPLAKKISTGRWSIGDGKRKYVFAGMDFAVTIRSRDQLYVN